ncbi:MAG: GNAT family N-acetyltransferase [Sphingomonadales bacterium]
MIHSQVIREGCDQDSEQVIKLIGDAFAEYPGCVLDVDLECPDLRAPASHFRKIGGRFWVAGSRQIVGTTSCAPIHDGTALELKRLYVAADARGRGLGTRLCELVEKEARIRGLGMIELWTDTRFLDAHRLYERLGYVRQQETRDLQDLSNTTEYRYLRILD